MPELVLPEADGPRGPGAALPPEMSFEEAELFLRILAGAAGEGADEVERLAGPSENGQPAPPLPAPVPIPALTPAAIQALVECVPDALVVADGDGRIVLVNPQTERLFGYARGELLGHTVELLVPERFRMRHIGQRAAFTAAPHARPMGAGLALTGRRKDGQEIPVEIALSPLPTDAGLLIVSSIRDVTDRRKAEDALQKLEKRYRTLVEEIPVVTFLAAMDESENELYVSPYIEKMLGFTQKEWLENPILWYTQLHPDDMTRWHEEFARTVATGETFRSIYRFIAKADPERPGEQRVVWVHGEARLVRDETGRPLFLQGVAFDITPMKEAEEELKALNASLEQRVAERTREVEAQARELARSNQDLTMFAGTAAHDLQAPLRTLTGELTVLFKKYRDRLEAGDTHIEKSLGSAGRMDRLIEGLLEFSKVRTEGKDPVPTSCAEAVAKACRNLQSDLDQYGAKIEWGELPTILADSSQLVRLFQNLIGNSLKFRIDGQRPEVLVAARRDGAEWVIEVRDNGIGIEKLKGRLTKVKDPLQKIFDLGIQSRQHTGDKYPGSGIGLSTCKNIVERHGGRIWAASDGLNKGTTIFFTMPAADEPE